jgi:hypothetical protein
LNETDVHASDGNRCLRYGLRIWWPNIISNKDLWRVTGQEDINLEIKKENLDGSVTHEGKKTENTKSRPTMEPSRKQEERKT